MDINLASKATKDLETIIANCVRLNKGNDPRCLAAKDELNRRSPLDLEKSRTMILSAASEERYLNYGKLAEASGAKWGPSVRNAMNRHLWDLVSHAHDRGWPMLSAIVVNKRNLETGKMDPETLKGFITAAHELGRRDIDAIPKIFLKKEQQRLFDFAKEHPNR